jgi:hypothetical protein
MSTALTRTDGGSLGPTLPPIDRMHQFAVAMADSSLVPDTLCMTKDAAGNEVRLPQKTVVANCLLVVDLAMRWEASPFVVAQCVAIVHGKLCVEGKLVHAIIEAKLGTRLKYTFDEKQGEQLGVTVSGTLPGEHEARTVEGNVATWRTKGNNSPWMAAANWKRQLRYRGAREWARAHAPAVLLGIYTPDEMEDPGVGPRDLTPAAAALPAPDIPDAPPAASAPPPLPPDPPHDPGTVEAKTTDAEFLAGLEGLLGQCASEAELKKHVEANKAEVEARGVEQATNDLVEKRRARMREIQAQAAAQEAQSRKPAGAAKADAAEPLTDADRQQIWVRVTTAMGEVGKREGAKLKDLHEVWKAEWDAIQKLPANWQAELTRHKDQIKAQLQQTEKAS